MRADLLKYLPYVEAFDLTEEQKADLICTLDMMMASFADRAFGLHPAQQCLPAARRRKSGKNASSLRISRSNDKKNEDKDE